MIRSTAFVGVALAVLVSASAAGADRGFRLVANESASVTVLKQEDVSDLFLKKRPLLNAGVAAEVVDQKEDSAVRKAFTKAIHDRSLGKIKSYWRKRLFAGESTPPVEAASDQEVLEFVRAHAGGLGYISPDTEPVGVQIVSVLSQPKNIKTVRPVYTRAAREAEATGVVIVMLKIDSEGKVSVLKVLQELPYGLTEAAIEAVESWKFRPAELDGEPTSAEIVVNLEFTLD